MSATRPTTIRLMAFILASAPVDCLEQAIALTDRYGGELLAPVPPRSHRSCYTAGDAQDRLNSRVIERDEAWRKLLTGRARSTRPSG